MNEQIVRTLVQAGAVRKVHIIGVGARLHVEIETSAGTSAATTTRGGIKTWSTLDTCARWVRGLGIGNARLDIERWQPEQRGLAL
jgi:hypothetical protein